MTRWGWRPQDTPPGEGPDTRTSLLVLPTATPGKTLYRRLVSPGFTPRPLATIPARRLIVRVTGPFSKQVHRDLSPRTGWHGKSADGGLVASWRPASIA